MLHLILPRPRLVLSHVSDDLGVVARQLLRQVALLAQTGRGGDASAAANRDRAPVLSQLLAPHDIIDAAKMCVAWFYVAVEVQSLTLHATPTQIG